MQIDWARVAADLAPIQSELAAAARRRKSRDYFWFSPVLETLLADKLADIVFEPADPTELATVVRYCFERRIPVTPRGGGSGNYGQAVPLHGGAVIDLSALTDCRLVRPGVVCAGSGTKLFAIDKQMRGLGWQLRLHPSTWKIATVGGFVAGGATGCGAINYGTLDTPGNILGVRLLTMEAEPRLLELQGADLRKVVHAYGLTGIITEVDMALTPAVSWHERVIAVHGFLDMLRLGEDLCRAADIHLNELAAISSGAARYFGSLSAHLVDGEDLIVALVAESSIDAFDRFVAERGGVTRFSRGPDAEPGKVPPIYEFCWNHTTLQAISRDKSVTYLQCLFGTVDPVATVAGLIERFGDEVPMHIEFGRLDGKVALMGMPLVRFTTADRLEAIMQAYREAGCAVYSPHTYMLENAGPRTADPVQFAFKRETDPEGLLNPGKMPGWPDLDSGLAESRATERRA